MFLTILLAFASQSPLRAEATAREQLQQFTAGLESLRARFTQTVHDADGWLMEQSEGEVLMSKPHYFRWDYEGEYPQQIVADGERVWIYDVVLEQVSVKSQSLAAADSPLTVLIEPELLDEQFRVSELGESEGLALLELLPLDEQTEFERILLGFSGNTMQMMILEKSPK